MLTPTTVGVLLNVLVILLCGIIGVCTGNPLVLLGLLLLRDVPFYSDEERQQMEEGEDQEEDGIYNENRAGFLRDELGKLERKQA